MSIIFLQAHVSMYPPFELTSVQLEICPVSQVDVGDWDVSLLAPVVQVRPLSRTLLDAVGMWGIIAEGISLAFIMFSVK